MESVNVSNALNRKSNSAWPRRSSRSWSRSDALNHRRNRLSIPVHPSLQCLPPARTGLDGRNRPMPIPDRYACGCGAMTRIHLWGPEQIVTNIQDQADGCPSCQWRTWKYNTTGGKRICDAGQPAFPNGGKSICIGTLGYKPKSNNKGNGRGRIDQKSR